MTEKLNLPDDSFFDGLRDESKTPVKIELDAIFDQKPKAAYPSMPEAKKPIDASFLPDDYTPPVSDVRYMKLEDGDNRLRILSQPILGWESWYIDAEGNSKPVRCRMKDQEKLKAYQLKEKTKHFWAMVVWSFKRKRPEILQITQASIRDGITTLTNNPEWGAPYFYDITITKSGQKLDTEYAVMAMPRSPLNIKEAMKELYNNPILLEKLYDNEDPFELSEEEKDFALQKVTHIWNVIQNGQQ